MGQTFGDVKPNDLIPVLENGGFWLTEYSAILKDLADKVDSPTYPNVSRWVAIWKTGRQGLGKRNLLRLCWLAIRGAAYRALEWLRCDHAKLGKSRADALPHRLVDRNSTRHAFGPVGGLEIAGHLHRRGTVGNRAVT